MIKLTKENIDNAIVNKGYNIVRKNENGYILTNETICTFNSLIIFRELFKNKCKMLDNALENLYYIADRLISCNDDDEPTPSDKYYNITVSTNKPSAKIYINGIQRSFATYPEGTKNIQIVATCDGYINKTYTISNLTRDYNIYLEFTAQDIIPTTRYSVLVNCNVEDATIEINGIERSYAQVEAGSNVSIRAYKEGYNTFETTIENISRDEVIDAILTEVAPGRVTLKLNITPSNANTNIYDRNTGIHYINVRSVTVDAGTAVDITVSAAGYISYIEENLVLNSNITRTIVLAEAPAPKYTILVNPTPNSATVTITNLDNGGVYGNRSEFVAGTRLRINVSASGYASGGMDYTVDADDAVDGVITKSILLVLLQNIFVRVFSDSLHTIPLTQFNAELEDSVSGETINPVYTSTANVVKFNGCIPGRTYNLRISKTNYTQQDNQTITVSNTNNQTFDVYMLANSYKFKVIVVDADNNNNPLQSATVLINGDAVSYNNGQSEEIDVPGGTQLTIEASASGYQTVAARTITMPFEDTVYNFPLSASVATVNITVLDSNNHNLTSDCIIKINGVTGNNQNVTPGTVNIDVLYSPSGPVIRSVMPFNENRTVVVGTNNITVVLANAAEVTFIGYKENTDENVPILFTPSQPNSNIVTYVDEYTITIKTAIGGSIIGDFSSPHYVTIHKELTNLNNEFPILEDLRFEQSDVKVTIVRDISDVVVYMDSPSNIITDNEIYVPKGTTHTFVASKQNHIDDVQTITPTEDVTLHFYPLAGLYIHVVDDNSNPVENASIYLTDPDDYGPNVFVDNNGIEASPGVYYVECKDIEYDLVVSKSGYVTNNSNVNVSGETHKYVLLRSTNVTLTIRVKNKLANTYINDATIYVDNQIITGNSVSLPKGSHTIKVEKSGFGTVTETINLTQNQTVTIEIKPSVTAHIHGLKGDVSGPAAYNGVHVVYLIGDSTIPQIVNNTDQNITYELPYNTNIKVSASATGYDAVEQTFRFTEETLEAFINIVLTGSYTLTINVVDDDTDNPIDNANVTFNIE